MYGLRLYCRHAAALALHPLGSRAEPLRLVLPALRNASEGIGNPVQSQSLNVAEVLALTGARGRL